MSSTPATIKVLSLSCFSLFLFLRFFTENPGYQAKFAGFKDVPINEIRGNKKVLAHALNVLYAISALVDNLDDPECLVEMLQKLGRNHYRHQITVPMFENLQSSLIGSMSQKLGSEVMNEAAQQAWKKAYGVIVAVVKQGLDAAAATSGQ